LAPIFTSFSRRLVNDPSHRRIAPEPVGIVHVLVAGEAPEHGLSQHPDQNMPAVPARASISQMLSRDYHQAEHVIQFAIGQQPGIRRDAGTVELQLHTAVEIEPSSVRFRFTRWVRHDRPRSDDIRF
jgi:hypothetical protein